MYQHCRLFRANFYPYVARHSTADRAFVLYLLGGERGKALEVCCENVLWREALGEFKEKETRLKFVELLVDRSRYAEAGEIYDEHLMDYGRAIECYMKGECYGRAFGAWKRLQCVALSQLSVAGDSEADDTAADREGCRDLPAGGDDAAGAPTDRPNAHVLSGAGGRLLASSKLALKNEIIRLNQLVGSFGKYKERICQVRQRLNENLELSQTSYSHSSLKSVRNALLKDRPGGVYEHEYVLNKLRELIVGVV